MPQSRALANVFKLNSAINAKDPLYGAKGDGVTNDTVALQAALDAARGRTLIIPQGVYLTDPLNIYAFSNTEIYGYLALLRLRSPGDLLSIAGDNTNPEITMPIHGLILDGNSQLNSKLIFVDRVHGVTFHDIQTYGVSGAGSRHVHLISAWLTKMSNCRHQAAGGVQCAQLLHVEGGPYLSMSCLFEFCRYLSNGVGTAAGEGILIEDSNANRFVGCDIEGNHIGTRIIATAGARSDNNAFVSCDWETSDINIDIGHTGSADPVIGTTFEDCQNIGVGNYGVTTLGEIYLDKAQGTRFENIATGNCQITTTANTKRTYWKSSYGGPNDANAYVTLNLNGQLYPGGTLLKGPAAVFGQEVDEWFDQACVGSTWSPTVRCTAGTNDPGGYGLQKGRWVRSGRMVRYYGTVYWTSWPGIAGNLQLVAPFNFRAGTNYDQLVHVIGAGGGFTWNAGEQLHGLGSPNTQYINIMQTNPATGTQTAVPATATGILEFSMEYEIQEF